MTDNTTPMYMPVAPAYGNGNYGGNGFFGNDGWWIILLLLCFNGGWGGMNGGINPMMMGLNTNADVQRGFDQSAIISGITGVQNAVTNGFSNVANGFAQAEISANARQMADMNQNFALQTQMSNCCCENRLATCQTQNIVQNEGAATRLAIQQQTQAILDKMCEQEIEALKAQNNALQTQVNMLNLAASQTAQTAALVADNSAQTQYIVNRVAPYPIPAYTVANPVTPVSGT